MGTSTTLIIIGGSSLKLFYKVVCGSQCGDSPLSTIEWYLVFALLGMVLTQLPNFNSIFGLSLLGVISAVSYCVLLWVLSITRTRPSGISYGAELGHSYVGSIFTILNALGIIAFCFRGHINVMEIQVIISMHIVALCICLVATPICFLCTPVAWLWFCVFVHPSNVCLHGDKQLRWNETMDSKSASSLVSKHLSSGSCGLWHNP